MRLASYALAAFVVTSLCIVPAFSQGYRAELSTRLPGGGINLPPVRAAAEDNGCTVVSATGSELSFRLSGRSNNLVVIRSDGGIAVRDTRELRSLKDVDRLNQDLATAYGYIEKVSASIPDEAKQACLWYGLKYRLADASTFQRFVFRPGAYKGVLDVPRCRVVEARFVALPMGNASLLLRGQRILRGERDESRVADVKASLVFGQHEIEISNSWAMNTPFALEAVTEPVSERVGYSGGNAQNVVFTPVLPISGRPSGPGPEDEATSSDTGNATDTGTPPEKPLSKVYQIKVDRKSVLDLVGQIKAKAVDATAQSRKVVAVSDFELIPDSESRQIDRVVARNVREDLSTGMADVGVFKVVERSQLAEALKNLKLDQSAIIDAATAKQLGKMVAADYVLIGSVSDRGATVVVNARMVDAQTGEVRYSASVETDKNEVPSKASAPADPPLDIDAIKERIAARPDDPQNYVDLAGYWLSKGNNAQCAQAMGKALHLDPDRFKPSSSVFDRLSRLSAKCGDLLAPYVGLLARDKGQTSAVTSTYIYHPGDTVLLELVDDTALGEATVCINDALNPKRLTPEGHAALFDISDLMKSKAPESRNMKLQVTATDGSGKNTQFAINLRVGK